jgi:hypothetical protein
MCMCEVKPTQFTHESKSIELTKLAYGTSVFSSIVDLVWLRRLFVLGMC